jgi:predicted TIM-barrel fold metal-dependent hydrolase
MSALQVVDFHNHFVGPGFRLTTLDRVPENQRAFWEAVNRNLSAPEALLASLEAGGVAARVISTPLEFLDADADVRRINDSLAASVARAPDRLYGLATVDAYAGEAAARELERAVRMLGLRDLFMESAKGGLLPDAQQARPTLEVAAALGVPVFLHPVPDPELDARFRRFGRMGVRLTRSTINSAALYALLEAGVFEALPKLRVVVTALAFGGLLLAAGMPDGSRLRKDTPSAQRRHVYVDTTGMDPVLVRSAIDLVGADHVVAGTDWPVVQEKSLSLRLDAVFDATGLGADARQAVAGGNARRLLGVSSVAAKSP